MPHKTWHSRRLKRKNRIIKKAYTRIAGVLAHPLVLKEVLKLCWCKWLSGSTSRILRSDNTSSCVNSHDLSVTRPTAAIMAPSLPAVSTVCERRAFTSSIAVYSSCLTFTSSIAVYSSCLKQTLLQLLKHISVRVLSSIGTSTSTRLLQVPRISSMSPCSSCVYVTVIQSQLSAAVHCSL